jgi:hypothetical protein
MYLITTSLCSGSRLIKNIFLCRGEQFPLLRLPSSDIGYRLWTDSILSGSYAWLFQIYRVSYEALIDLTYELRRPGPRLGCNTVFGSPQWKFGGTDPEFCSPTFRRLNGPQAATELVPHGAGNEIKQQPARRMKSKSLASRRSELTNVPEKDLSPSIPQCKNPRRKPAGSITKPVQVTKSKKKCR